MITHAGREIQKYTSAVKVFIIICVHIRVVHLDVLHAHNFAHRFGRDMPPWVELHLASGRFRCPCPREGQILRHYSIMPQQRIRRSLKSYNFLNFWTQERRRNGWTHNAFRDCPMQSQWDPLTDGCSGHAGWVSTTFLRLPLLRSPFQHHVIVSAANGRSCYEEFRKTLRHFLR